MHKTIIIATCQHSTSADISANYKWIKKQISFAKSNHADIVHFSECSLSGYAGIDFKRITEHDKIELENYLEKTKKLARKLKIHVIIGSHHFEKEQRLPFNSLFLIDDQGITNNRYDKRLLTGIEGEQDRKHYTPGHKPVIFNIKGINCGLLICHEWRYPELYREYKRMNVELIFQSFYDGGLSEGDYIYEGKEQGDLITGTLKGYAANNHLWISASNTGKRESCFPSLVIQPDGIIRNKLRRNMPGVLITEIDLDEQFIDPSGTWRGDILRKYLFS